MSKVEQRPNRIFYGWWIVGVVFLISCYVAGIVTFGFTAIIQPIASEFGWSYAQISVAASIRGLEGSFVAPFVGSLTDRFGSRTLIILGIIFTGLGLLLFHCIINLSTFYGVFILLSVGLSTCANIVPLTVVGNWFKKNLSTATGIVTSGPAMGGLLLLLVTWLVDIFKWRGAMMVLGLGALVILLPLSLVIRHKPEQYGYLPDGIVNKATAVDKVLTSKPGTEVDISVSQVIKSKVFWHISLGLACHILVLMAVITHIMPYLSSIGVTRSTSSLVASAIPLTGVLGRLSFGWFGDRYDKKSVAALGFLIASLGLVLLSYAAHLGIWLLVPCVVFLGIGYGGPFPVILALVQKYFGRVRLGTTIGLVMGIASLGSMIGPPLIGWIFDNFGSYQGAWLACFGLLIAGMVSLITIPSARKTELVIN